MRANILLHDKRTALAIAKVRRDNDEYDEFALLQGLPDYVFSEAFEAVLKYEEDIDAFTWVTDESNPVNSGWHIEPMFVQRVEVLDV